MACAATRQVDRYTEPLAAALARWKGVHAGAALAMTDEGHRLVIRDQRTPGQEADCAALDGAHRDLYLACDAIRTDSELAMLLERKDGARWSPEAVRNLLEPMVRQGWMAQEGNAHLSLAIPAPART